jgi:hypothetical protein
MGENMLFKAGEFSVNERIRGERKRKSNAAK